MATTVYLPDTSSRQGEAIAGGIQNAAAIYAEQMAKKKEAEELEKVLRGINEAPDRNTALQVVGASAPTMQDPNRVSMLFRAVDERHPLGNNELQQAKVYSPTTGAETPFWFKRGDIDKITDPNFVAERTGLPPDAFTLTKPAKVFDYVDPASGNSVGTFVPGMQPSGVVTAEDFTRRRQLEQDERKIDADERSEKRLEFEERRLTATEKRAAAAERKASQVDNESKNTKQISTEQNRLKSYLVTQYGGKTLADGSLDLSTLDEPKRRKFTEDFDRASELLDEGKVKTFGAAVRAVNKERKEKKGPFADAPDAGKPPAAADSTLPKGATRGKVLEEFISKGKKFKGYKVLDAKGKHIGWDIP